ncbi:MAG: Secretion system C-terminal sorting domain [Bacteroidota bacterium]|jgi:hypothetical protein
MKSLLFTLTLLLSISAFSQCTSIDQSSLHYNSGTSARNLAGYSEWQHFKAGSTGILCKIEVGLFNFMNGTGIFKVYEGIGPTGNVLSEDTVLISGDGNFFFPFDVSIPITAGSDYSFHLIPILTGGLPDPYGVQADVPGTYANGEMYLVDPSGSYATGFDMIFKTYVELNTGLIPQENNPKNCIYPNPVNGTALLTSPSLGNKNQWEIIGLNGQIFQSIPVNSSKTSFSTQTLSPGLYIARFKQDEQIIYAEKLIVVE